MLLGEKKNLIFFTFFHLVIFSPERLEIRKKDVVLEEILPEYIIYSSGFFVTLVQGIALMIT